MAPKGVNTKKESGRAKKAENEAKKADVTAASKERKEAESWTDKDVKGGKAKKEMAEEKRKADLARKAENARLLAAEESSIQSEKAKAAGPKKKGAKPAGPGAIAAGGLASPSDPPIDAGEVSGKPEEVESYAATGIDNALDLLEVVTAKMDKASLGQQAAKIEQHPERRFKAALKAYQERELENIKKEHPGLRLHQLEQLLYKQFQKSPENPFNQATVSHDASKEEKIEALNRRKADIENRLREK